MTVTRAYLTGVASGAALGFALATLIGRGSR